MPLKNIPEDKNDKNISGALSTEEIVSLLNKSNKDFIKESDISSNITNLFKKVTPHLLAEKNKDTQFSEENLKENKEENEEENKEQTSIENEVKKEEPLEEKKYTEVEAKKMANEFAKQYYNNGYRLGVKKTSEELQKGDKALAVTLKNTTDAIFQITPNFTKELTQSITGLLSNLCKEILGNEIDNNSKFFQEKVTQMVNSFQSSLSDIQVYLNPLDCSAIKKYNSENKLELSFHIEPDEKLERGDIRIKSGSIEMSDIVSNKLKFSIPNQLDTEIDSLKIKSDKQEKTPNT